MAKNELYKMEDVKAALANEQSAPAVDAPAPGPKPWQEPNEAITQMVEDNVNQRESILPSERAKALKIQFSDRCAFIFCNKNKNSIKVLRYDKNGFVLASKRLLDEMKFQWPKDASEYTFNMKNITSLNNLRSLNEPSSLKIP